MKKFLALMLAIIMLLAMVSCSGEDETVNEGNEEEVIAEEEILALDNGDSFTYATNESGDYDIIAFSTSNSTPHKVEIPAEIDNIDVTGIADGAFKSNNRISEIVIPDTVEYIGEFAFWGCTHLEKVTMADSVTEIKTGAFKECGVLSDVKLSAALTKISDFTFWGCTALETVVIPTAVTEISDAAFLGCKKLKNVTVPASVKVIGDCAFYGNEALEKITLPAGVESFGSAIFNAGNEAITLVVTEGSKP